jgi:hypothetical protein
MKNIKTIQQEINQFVKEWDHKSLISFMADIYPLVKLYDADIENGRDWVADEVGQEDARNVRVVRTVYLLSIIAEKHAAKLCRTNVQFNKMWQRLEKQSESM